MVGVKFYGSNLYHIEGVKNLSLCGVELLYVKEKQKGMNICYSCQRKYRSAHGR